MGSRQKRGCNSFREGDFIETHEGLIFDVKGLVHPPHRVIAFIRYVSSLEGDRKRDARRYRKVYDLDERFAFIRENYPQYLVYDPVFGEELIEVPVEQVTRHYQPICKLAELRSRSDLNFLERRFLGFADFVVGSSHVPRGKVGVSGSVLVGLASSSSDLDLIVYGADNALKVNSILGKRLAEGKRLRKYDRDALKTLHKDRCSRNGVSLEDYVFHELRKPFQGFFDGVEFFVRYIKDWDEGEEAYGESVYSSMGQAKIRCVVVDDSDSLFTPCYYGVEDVEVVDGALAKPVLGITSFRGRFCQQAFAGERVMARGKLERVACRDKTYYRLVLGNRPEDFMVAVR